MKVRTRFAPSPTGFMHIGNLRTALYAYLFAKANGGDFILRIEDTDRERETDGAVDLVMRVLEKTGLHFDEGPGKDGGFGPYIQSRRKYIYAKYAAQLIELGGAYYCFCDKARLESLTDENGIRKYDKHCLSLSKDEVNKRLAAGVPYVIRQNIPLSGRVSYEDMVFGEISVDCADMEDNVLIKSDGFPTYNFANVVDDHLMQISHVIRGVEYLSSTPKYNLIYNSFGWELPKYMHLPPIMKDAQRKLSKRYGDANFEDFIQKGFLSEAIINYIALLGWSPGNNLEKMTMDQLVSLFSVDGVSKSGSIFDEPKMRWLNGLYIKELDDNAFAEHALPYYEKSVIAGRYDYSKWNAILKTRIDTFGDIPEKVAFIDKFDRFDTALFINQKQKNTLETAKAAIAGAIEFFESVPEFTFDAIHDGLIAKAEQLSLKKGQMLWSVRIGLTAHESTPGGAFEIADILGREECLKRLRFSLGLL